MKNRRLCALLFVLATGFAAWSYFGLDRKLLEPCRQIKQLSKPFWEAVTQAGLAGPWVITAALCWLFFRYRQNPNPVVANRAAFFFVAVAAAGVANTLIKVCCGRARPSMWTREGVYGFHGFSVDSHYGSFPSGHSNTAAAVALALAILFPRYRWLFLVFALLVATSRVILGAHYLSDVIVGLCTGVAGVLVVARFWKFRSE